MPPVVAKKRHKSSKYTEKLANYICNRIAKGESVKSICRDMGNLSPSTVIGWLLDSDKQNFYDQYARARNVQAELLFEELNALSDSASSVIVGGEDKADNARVQAIRLQVDTRKWYLSKVLPKKYGDKLDLTSGGDKLPTPILQLNTIRQTIHEQKPEELPQ